MAQEVLLSEVGLVDPWTQGAWDRGVQKQGLMAPAWSGQKAGEGWRGCKFPQGLEQRCHVLGGFQRLEMPKLVEIPFMDTTRIRLSGSCEIDFIFMS